MFCWVFRFRPGFCLVRCSSVWYVWWILSASSPKLCFALADARNSRCPSFCSSAWHWLQRRVFPGLESFFEFSNVPRHFRSSFFEDRPVTFWIKPRHTCASWFAKSIISLATGADPIARDVWNTLCAACFGSLALLGHADLGGGTSGEQDSCRDLECVEELVSQMVNPRSGKLGGFDAGY